MNENLLFPNVAGGCMQQPHSFQSYQSQQMQMAAANQNSMSIPTIQTNYFMEQQNQRDTQNFDLNKTNIENENSANYSRNGHLQDNDTVFQGHQQMAVSSPSVSSTADMNGPGQNGIKSQQQQQFGFFGGFPQQMSESAHFNGQQLNGSTCPNGTGDFMASQQQQHQAMMLRLQQQQTHFPMMNGQMLNGGAPIRFPMGLPSPAMPSQKRTFVFNSDMANFAAQSIRQQMVEDMTIWHLKYCVPPSTSRGSLDQQQKVTMNNSGTSDSSSSPAPAAARGVKRKVSAQTTTESQQQPHSMSLSPHDIRPPYTPIGHPQSVPITVGHLDQQQQPHSNAQNELCDSSTNGDDFFKRPSSQIPPNGTMTNYLQNSSFGQMEENPLKKMEIMTSKTLNEPSGMRMFRMSNEEDPQQQQSANAIDISRQEKIRKLAEIEKSLLPLQDPSPSYSPQTSSGFSDFSQLRPPIFGTPGQMMQAPPQFATMHHRMMAPFASGSSMGIPPMMNPNHQQICAGGPISEQQQSAGMMQGMMMPFAPCASDIQQHQH